MRPLHQYECTYESMTNASDLDMFGGTSNCSHDVRYEVYMKRIGHLRLRWGMMRAVIAALVHENDREGGLLR